MPTLEGKLKDIIASLDISASDFVKARTRYRAAKDWLVQGRYRSGNAPSVYLQGSFRLGTVVRPYYADADGDFDIDQVCELTARNAALSPSRLKNDIGDRLKTHGTYSGMLDDEGKRCWTLIYASSGDAPGFHLDVLPSVTSAPAIRTQIDITDLDKTSGTYDWSTSDPNGYYQWFKSKNVFSNELLNRQRAQIFESHQDLFETIESVPKRLIRSSLQRAIQLMKRHRDVHFSGQDYKPISIIITTIAAHLYNDEDIFQTIEKFADYVIDRHEVLLKTGTLPFDGVLDYVGGQWLITNPVHGALALSDCENFADRWNTDQNYPLAFFSWVYALRRALKRFQQSESSRDLDLKLSSQDDRPTYRPILTGRIQTDLENGEPNTIDLLDLIHLAIDGLADWSQVANTAQNYLTLAQGQPGEDVFKINFYQVSRHRGQAFTQDERDDIRNLIQHYRNNPGFILCGNLLLGSATQQMLTDCLNSEYGDQDVLTWPILRLAGPDLLLP